MITSEQIQTRSRNTDELVTLANALVISEPVRSCDPIQVWEAHPVISQYLHLKDREIAAAIDAANAVKG